ncbi:MAG: hypoxanthine phosphoribosyltransferase [Phycisphaeraceae bacterium]
MQDDIEHVLIDRDTIQRRIDELAVTIAKDLEAETADGPGEITLVPILTGSIIFLADLIRRLPIPMQIRVMTVTSYPGTATTSQGASIEASLTKLPEDLSNNHVLVIDDILDSGNTLRQVRQTIEKRNPISLRTCVLLRKQIPSAMSFPVDYVAFDIPNEFVVGYGLDYNDYYRNLPDIVTLKQHVYANA